MQREYKISLSQEYYSDVVYLSQYDDDYDVIFHVINKYSAADVGGKSAKFTGTRTDGFGFTFNAVAVGSSVSFHINTSLTACAGTHTAEIVFYDSNDLYFGSANVQVIVEKAAHPEGTIDADEEQLRELAAQVQEIVNTAAATVKGEAEAWAVGQRDGVDVPSTDPAYENNAKYYSEQAAQIAEDISGVTDQVATNTSDISDLKEDLSVVGNSVFELMSVQLSWEHGTIELSAGADNESNTRVRTIGVRTIGMNETITAENGFKYVFRFYKTDGTFAGYSDWLTGTNSVNDEAALVAGATKYRLVGAYSNDASTVSDEALAAVANAITVTCEVNKIDRLEDTLKEDLSAVSCKTNIEWVLGKSIDASGELFTQASCATSKEIQCQAGDVFVCKNARKDANDKWFIGFLVMYTLANGVLTFVERQAFTESSNPQTVIPSGVNLCYIVFGRQSLSGVTMTAEDIATYSSYEIYRKGIGAKESIFPFGTAVQTSCDTDGCLAVTSVKTGSNVVYTLKDNAPSKTWYTSFACRGINYQITNNETYSTTYQIAFTDNLASASNNAYQNVCLCINLASKTLIWKNNRDLTVDDYVMQVFLNGKNITPWYMSAFAEAGVIDSLLDGYPTKPDFLTRNLYKVFKKVGAIGDSWTAGYLSTGSHTYGKSDGYAWPDYMETDKNKWVNGGYSGATTKTYLTDEIPSNGGGHLAIEAAGQCQAYVIGLGFNDSRPVEEEGVPVGAIGDIGDSSKDTFYYWYSHIIDWAVNLNEDAFVFCQTMYPPLNNGETDFASRFAPYNTAIRDIVAYYQNGGNNKIRLLDLEARADLYAALGRGWDVNGSHHGCVGYEFLAECLKSVLGDELAEHPDLYHNIREIPYTA